MTPGMWPAKMPTIEEAQRRQLACAFTRQFMENVLPNFPLMKEYEQECVMMAEIERLLSLYCTGTAEICAHFQKIAEDALACSLPKPFVMEKKS